MPAPRQHVLATTGRPEHEALERNLQRVIDGQRSDMGSLDASRISYTPANASDWVSPAPTTVQAALDRLGAAGGVTPVP